VDLDYEDNEAMNAGKGEQWIITCTKTLRQYLPVEYYILTQAPQAPYFSTTQYIGGGYTYVDKEVGDLIDWYNVQFYNQGSSNAYNTYETLFVQSGGYWTGTSIGEIIAHGVPASKILLGKPATATDVSNTGLSTASDVGTWAAQGK